MKLYKFATAVAAGIASLALAVAGAPSANAIIYGTQATDSDGMAAVMIDGQFTCSGSIVDNYWVLTAKHCLYENIVVDTFGHFVSGNRVADSRITVRVKSLDRTSGGGVVQVATSRVRSSNDIAMLKLDRSANASPVRLSTSNPAIDETTYQFGWGLTCTGKATLPNRCGDPSTTLKRATTTVVATNDQDAFGGSATRTTGGNGWACVGDSGGPIFRLVNGLRYQVGVQSTVNLVQPGQNCSAISKIGSVPVSRDWILNVIATV